MTARKILLHSLSVLVNILSFFGFVFQLVISGAIGAALTVLEKIEFPSQSGKPSSRF